MKIFGKARTILCCFLIVAALTGCGREDPYRVDTVVRIPVDPTQPPTVAAETETPETAEPTQIQVATEAPKSSGSKNTSGGKNTSGNKTSSGTTAKVTEPPETKPAPTEPAVTEPPVTQPQPTQPPATELPATEPEETEPAITEPSETVPPTQPPADDPSSYVVGSLEYAILEELNAYRAEAGLPALSLSTKLCGIAAIRAEEISRVWSHTRPDGRSYTTVMSDYGYGCGASAENLVYVSGSGDAAAIVAKWMGADNKNSILSESLTTAGIGIYRSGGVTYVANLLVG